ncbi:unnamed protein product [Effrenium voratum]|nr:unnamed protein product [Effrenium voratum]
MDGAIDAEEQKQVRRELAALFHQHYVVPGAGTTAREVRDMAAALRFIRSLRCGEASWCAKAAPLRSLRRSEEEEILQRLHASQNPANCEDARYLVFHDDRTTSGFGWNAFILFSAFLQERVLVEAAAVSDRDHQRPLHGSVSSGPDSQKGCYALCERGVCRPVATSRLDAHRSEPSALWRASQRSDETFFPSCGPQIRDPSMVAKGRFWWYAAMVPGSAESPAFDGAIAMAAGMSCPGVSLNQSFIVATSQMFRAQRAAVLGGADRGNQQARRCPGTADPQSARLGREDVMAGLGRSASASCASTLAAGGWPPQRRPGEEGEAAEHHGGRQGGCEEAVAVGEELVRAGQVRAFTGDCEP